MRPDLVTAAPPLLTISAAIWLSWGLVDGPPPDPARRKSVKIDAASLSPTLEAPSARDPFQSPAALLARAAAPSDGAAGAKPPRDVAPPPRPAVPTDPPKASNLAFVPGLARAMSRTVASALSGMKSRWETLREEAEARERLSREVQSQVADQARLSATSIRGASRFAVLNDRMYAEGEVIPGLGSLKGPLVVSIIRPNSVVLRYRGASAVVSFPPISRAARSAPLDNVKSSPAASAVATPKGRAVRPTGRPPGREGRDPRFPAR